MNELEHKRRAGPAAEAEVIGKLLAAARPTADAARDAALLERIMTAVERTPRLVTVAPTAGQTLTSTRPHNQVAAPLHRPSQRRDLWGAASVLAASLVIGFMAGQMSLPHAAVQSVAEASGVSLGSASHDVATVLAGAERGDDE